MKGDKRPLLFEIGRYRPVDLSADPSSETIHPGKRYITDSPQLYIDPFQRIMGTITLMLLLAIVVLSFTNSTINAYARWSGNWAVTVATIALAALVVAGICGVIACAISSVSHQPGEEPFSLF